MKLAVCQHGNVGYVGCGVIDKFNVAVLHPTILIRLVWAVVYVKPVPFGKGQI